MPTVEELLSQYEARHNSPNYDHYRLSFYIAGSLMGAARTITALASVHYSPGLLFTAIVFTDKNKNLLAVANYDVSGGRKKTKDEIAECLRCAVHSMVAEGSVLLLDNIRDVSLQ